MIVVNNNQEIAFTQETNAEIRQHKATLELLIFGYFNNFEYCAYELIFNKRPHYQSTKMFDAQKQSKQMHVFSWIRSNDYA